jgi:hypothetical protein
MFVEALFSLMIYLWKKGDNEVGREMQAEE